MSRASRPHTEAVVELLRNDPAVADEYLQAAMEQADEQGGREALLSALRHVAEAQGGLGACQRFDDSGLDGKHIQ